MDAYSWWCLDRRGVELPGCSREHSPPQSRVQESFCSSAGRKLSAERMAEGTAAGFLPVAGLAQQQGWNSTRCLQAPPKTACNMWKGFFFFFNLGSEFERRWSCQPKAAFNLRSLQWGWEEAIAPVWWCGKQVMPYLRERACLSCYCRKVICQEQAVLACCIPLLRS